ncbi:MAG: hypothetical protein EKK29_18355 [Hyphomicrobiales bacterium]|nr:MAG: hypothetical protein EKK29_18355 [Hyphomicrobiales bacterium]
MADEKVGGNELRQPEKGGAFLSDAERREALKKIGRYAVYASPLMVGLLKADKARADIPPGSIPPE